MRPSLHTFFILKMEDRREYMKHPGRGPSMRESVTGRNLQDRGDVPAMVAIRVGRMDAPVRE